MPILHLTQRNIELSTKAKGVRTHLKVPNMNRLALFPSSSCPYKISKNSL